jgi:hypothetical protein
MRLRSELRRPNMGLVFNRDSAIKWLAIVLMMAGAGIGLCAILKNRLKPPEKRILSFFLKKMERLGYPKDSSQGLEEFVSCIGDEAIRRSAYVFVTEFEARYFRDVALDRQSVKQLRAAIKAIGP